MHLIGPVWAIEKREREREGMINYQLDKCHLIMFVLTIDASSDLKDYQCSLDHLTDYPHYNDEYRCNIILAIVAVRC